MYFCTMTFRFTSFRVGEKTFMCFNLLCVWILELLRFFVLPMLHLALYDLPLYASVFGWEAAVGAGGGCACVCVCVCVCVFALVLIVVLLICAQIYLYILKSAECVLYAGCVCVCACCFNSCTPQHSTEHDSHLNCLNHAVCECPEV